MCDDGSIPYQRIEYLESTGTQYITLPLSVQSTDYFEVGGEMIIRGTSGYYFSSNPLSQFSMSYYQYNTASLQITTKSSVGGDTYGGGHSLIKDAKTSFALSTTFKRTKETVTPLVRPLTNSISGFRLYGCYGSASSSKVAFGSFYIKVNDTIVYDFVPVRIEQTGYMYDKISGDLFGNNGGGNFKLGLDVGSKELLYYWDAEDSLVDGKWVDRVNGIVATPNTTPNKVNGMYELQASGYSPLRNFSLSNLNSGNTKIYLPAAWKCECEFMVPTDVIIDSGKALYPFDFGSLTQATHAFGLSYASSGIGLNYKPIGNGSNSSYGLAKRTIIELGKIIDIEFGTDYVNDSEVILYMKVGDEIVYGVAPSPATIYDESWNVQYGYFGTGYASSYASGRVYLKSLKFFSNI